MRPERKYLNCAIYTRKSSEEGLEQEFNSLHAQREACEAYIQSQRHEGWKMLSGHYDDGGFSGGTMDRPGLRQLLADIDAGKVHVVVVYKVDRLTRALGDFARIVETFDAKGVSFVSVTQQFNTTSSMGRLTLNVLLSFAQFEREVTGERIRDKIAASKKKGMWMGGNLPLGYDTHDRKLVINEAEAATVRHIFERYVALGSVRKLKTELDAAGIVSKVRTSKAGNITGGKPFARGALYKLLSNRIYIGEIVHIDRSYPGEHKAILDPELWDQVQVLMSENRIERHTRTNIDDPSLLVGLIFDNAGSRMTPSHACKQGVRYRYYVSSRDPSEKAKSPILRLPAREIETLVKAQVTDVLGNPERLLDALPELDIDIEARRILIGQAKLLAGELEKRSPASRIKIIRAVVARIDVHRDRVEIAISRQGIVALLLGDVSKSISTMENDFVEPATIVCPWRIRKRGVETKLLLQAGGTASKSKPDPYLVRAIARAHVWNRQLINGSYASGREIARAEGVTARYIYKLLPLAFLAPDIVEAISQGRQPGDLTLRSLTTTGIPDDWAAQRRRFGFSSI